MTGQLTAEGLADAGCSKEMLERFEALRRTSCTREEAYSAQPREDYEGGKALQ